MLVTIAFLLVTSSQVLAQDAALPKELVPLQGVWRLTERAHQGQRLPERLFSSTRYVLVIDGDQFVLDWRTGRLKPGLNTLDLEVAKGQVSKDRTLLAIYDLQGDTLRLAVANPYYPDQRPTQFESTSRHSHTFYTFKRDRNATREETKALMKELVAFIETSPAVKGRATNDQELVNEILERLERIEKRIGTLEKKLESPTAPSKK